MMTRHVAIAWQGGGKKSAFSRGVLAAAVEAKEREAGVSRLGHGGAAFWPKASPSASSRGRRRRRVSSSPAASTAEWSTSARCAHGLARGRAFLPLWLDDSTDRVAWPDGDALDAIDRA
jgi:hypothetical protein